MITAPGGRARSFPVNERPETAGKEKLRAELDVVDFSIIPPLCCPHIYTGDAFRDEERSMIAQRVLLIGLDAACFAQLDPLLASGSLPNIQRLIDTGVGVDLETTTPPWTPSAWPSVTTGSTP